MSESNNKPEINRAETIVAHIINDLMLMSKTSQHFGKHYTFTVDKTPQEWLGLFDGWRKLAKELGNNES